MLPFKYIGRVYFYNMFIKRGAVRTALHDYHTEGSNPGLSLSKFDSQSSQRLSIQSRKEEKELNQTTVSQSIHV